MEKAKFQQTFDKWVELNRELYKDCKDYLVDVLKKAPDNEIIINEEHPCCVTTSGNHPEYDASPFDGVSMIYLKNGTIYLDTENFSQYDIDEINANDLCNVADAVFETLLIDYDIN